jgi:hypothetical protein
MYHVIKVVSSKRKTEKYMMISIMLDDYWETLTDVPNEFAIIRYEAYKKELLRQFNIYEFDFNNWRKQMYNG